MVDAVVIGAGVNGLVAANLLADAGWSVAVLEAQDAPGGACRSGTPAHQDFTVDLFSAFYPLAVASPVLADLRLEEHGLAWAHAPTVLAHPLPDRPAAVLRRDPAATAAGLDTHAPGDGAAWQAAFGQWQRLREPLLDVVLGPFPPLRAATRLLRRTGAADALRLARLAALPVRRYAAEEFRSEAAALLFAGNALHADLGPESAGSAVFGWLLAMLGQEVGFPAVRGGAGNLTGALLARARARGVTLTTNARVAEVLVRSGTACGVRLADGTEISAHRAVLADVDAPQLYGSLLSPDQLPARLLDDLGRFHWDYATVTVDWALSGPIPWADPNVAGAGTVHLGGTFDDLSRGAAELQRGLVPARPFVVLGQMTTADPTRSPAGTESAWGYLHVPQEPRGDAGGQGISGRWTDDDVARLVDRLEAQVEAAAPGFRGRVVGRAVRSPLQLEASDAVLHRGALNGGTAALHQQLFLRPVPGLGRPETPVRGLYLASMSAHPGGGVHGAPGANAARAALRAHGLLGPVRVAGWRALQRALLAP